MIGLEQRVLWPLAVAAAFVFVAYASWAVLGLVDFTSVLPDQWVAYAELAAHLSVIFFGPLGVFAVLRVAEAWKRLLWAFLLITLLLAPFNAQLALAGHVNPMAELEHGTAR